MLWGRGLLGQLAQGCRQGRLHRRHATSRLGDQGRGQPALILQQGVCEVQGGHLCVTLLMGQVLGVLDGLVHLLREVAAAACDRCNKGFGWAGRARGEGRRGLAS